MMIMNKGEEIDSVRSNRPEREERENKMGLKLNGIIIVACDAHLSFFSHGLLSYRDMQH